jgi:hypothetical protein
MNAEGTVEMAEVDPATLSAPPADPAQNSHLPSPISHLPSDGDLSPDDEDPIREANREAHASTKAADRLMWPPEDVADPPCERRRLLLTWGRAALFETLSSATGADTLSGRRLKRSWIDAAILLFLAYHEEMTWEKKRFLPDPDDPRRRVVLDPLVADDSRFFTAIRAWADTAIGLPLKDRAMEVAGDLWDLHHQTQATSIEPADPGPPGALKNAPSR